MNNGKKKVSGADALMCVGYDRSQDYVKRCDVGGGAWVLVKCKIPVEERIRPQTYGIYWAIPHKDKYKRQMCKIYTPEEVCLLNYEYTVISEDLLQEYRDMGYYLKDYGIKGTEPLNLQLILEGRSLVEEEREIIWAFMLDGLSEQQAWREIAGASGYFVSNFGNVKSTNYRGTGKERHLKTSQNTCYRMVCIRGKVRYVHRLVAEAFIPNPEGKEQVNHINCDPHDNRAKNLEWVTKEENHAKYFESEKFKRISEEQRRMYSAKR